MRWNISMKAYIIIKYIYHKTIFSRARMMNCPFACKIGDKKYTRRRNKMTNRMRASVHTGIDNKCGKTERSLFETDVCGVVAFEKGRRCDELGDLTSDVLLRRGNVPRFSRHRPWTSRGGGGGRGGKKRGGTRGGMESRERILITVVEGIQRGWGEWIKSRWASWRDANDYYFSRRWNWSN